LRGAKKTLRNETANQYQLKLMKTFKFKQMKFIELLLKVVLILHLKNTLLCLLRENLQKLSTKYGQEN